MHPRRTKFSLLSRSSANKKINITLLLSNLVVNNNKCAYICTYIIKENKKRIGSCHEHDNDSRLCRFSVFVEM